MIRRLFLMSMMLLCTLAVAHAKDIKKVVFTTTPQMHCENCETKIKGNLRFEKGVKNIETNIEAQSVTVTYDADVTDTSKLQNAFTKFGYKAEVKTEKRGQHAGVKARVSKSEKANDCDAVSASTQQANKRPKKK